MAKEDGLFRVRLNCLDHYQSPPSPLDPPLWGASSTSSTQRGSLPNVPVVRVFGATENGQKVCAHIHGALPYLFIPYTGGLGPEDVGEYTKILRQSIDHALALSYRRNPYADAQSSQFVAHVSLVKGVPFFGYNVGYTHYLKIYLLNPAHMTRFADLLRQGVILQQVFQPFEAHLQYLLQWMCDYNLYGCAFVETREPRFRQPLPVEEEVERRDGWHTGTVGAERILNSEMFPRQSHCHLEVDIRVEDILNRREVKPRDLHHSFIERLASLEGLPPEEKLVHSMAGLWKDETRRRKRRMGITDPTSSPFAPEVLVSMSADPRNTDKGGWIHEEEFREMVGQLAQQEKEARGGHALDFDTFLSESPGGDAVQTVLESVEDLFQERLSKHHGLNHGPDSVNGGQDDLARSNEASVSQIQRDALVDLRSIAQLADDDDFESDEELEKTKALTQLEKNTATVDAGLDDTEPKAVLDTEVDEMATDQVDGATTMLQKRTAPDTSQGRFKRVKFSNEADDSHARRAAFRVRDAVVSKDSPPRLSTAVENNKTPDCAQKATRHELSDDFLGVPSGQPAPPSQQSTASPQSGPSKKSVPGFAESSRESHANNIRRQQDLDPHLSSQIRLSSVASSRETPGKHPCRPGVDAGVVANYARAFGVLPKARTHVFAPVPPSFQEVQTTVEPPVIYQDAYYSNEKDVPERLREYAGQEFRLESNTLPYLQDFDVTGARRTDRIAAINRTKQELSEAHRRRQCTLRTWEILRVPPTAKEVEAWLEGKAVEPADDLHTLAVDDIHPTQRLARDTWAKPAAMPTISQIDGPTQKNKHGFKYTQHNASTSVQHATGYMSTMSLEVHANSPGELAPDPERDPVNMIVWCLAGEEMDRKARTGIILLDEDAVDFAARVQKMVGADVEVVSEDSELDVLNRVVDTVRAYDPDILTGYEVHNGSWGYLIERARLQYEFNLPDELSRMKAASHGRFGKDADRWGFTHTSTVRITGRHTINIWRAMRSELNLLQYTLENVVFHLLHRRIPHYSFATLTQWFRSPRPRDLAKALDHLTTRAQLNLQILHANELIARTSEQARLLGVDFFSVFSRGSQFKVESLMFRIAKPESYLLVSPSRKQVGAQNALECLPLVMEPQSAFYTSPVLVLDFQSLYPSVMIAYNYCYSTCLGRIANWRGTNKLGFADFARTPGLLELVRDKLNVAPNGMMYVQPEVRKSLLAKMLGEILETRVMVKSGMKADRHDRTLQQLLNNRQLALKLIANVTYGYTSASFSGRMPCAEIADSIVQTGRETLEKAIAMIHSVARWDAEVVYGDTDSLFIHLPGRTRADAFKIGDEIAQAVTDANPRPVKLKFEKVYHPCVLLAKKRYVGFKYESVAQTEPEFDAKGIETVRRDGTPAEQKMEEKALKLLFRTRDLSQVKRYFQTQCGKILAGAVSIQDFCFAKEVKLGTYAERGGPAPPGALVAAQRMLRDPRREPQHGERVPYVVVAGAPGARLFERCVEPERLVHDDHAELDADYYITKNLIPPLERIFNLVGANVRAWWEEMPRVQRVRKLVGPREGARNRTGTTMESYMGSSVCLVCRARLPAPAPGAAAVDVWPLCGACRHGRAQATLLALRRRVSGAEETARAMQRVCRSCAGVAADEAVACDSRDCPVFYSRVKAETRLRVERRGTGRVLARMLEEQGALEW